MAPMGLFSAARDAGFDLRWREMAAMPRVRGGNVLVKVSASSINPIDVKRAAGYGARVLRLKGAAGMPRVLGNDVVGVVQEVGAGVSEFAPGQRVWGVMDTGPVGAHASHVVLPAAQLLPAPESISDELLAALPYTFCTMWRSLRSAGIHPGNAKARRVLVHGASGGLGLLALQVLAGWGAHTTAVCSAPMMALCRSNGASDTFDRSHHAVQDLPSTFDVILNFATWNDELVLADKLAPQALGMASTTHPLLGTLDRLGLLRGVPQLLKERGALRQVVQRRSPHAAYQWTIFRPDAEALAALGALAMQRKVHLPIGITCPIDNAIPAFAHVAQQGRGRAVLTFPR